MTDLNAAMTVIRAAQRWARIHPESEDANTALNELAGAVRALDHEINHDMTGPTEIEWRDIMPGDQLKADKGENFYPVEHVTHFTGELGKIRATLTVNDKPTALLRPADRIVTVVRGPEGVALDMLKSAGLGPSLIDTENHS